MTKSELKAELKIITKDATTFEEMIDLIIDYIARNFGRKKNV